MFGRLSVFESCRISKGSRNVTVLWRIAKAIWSCDLNVLHWFHLYVVLQNELRRPVELFRKFNILSIDEKLRLLPYYLWLDLVNLVLCSQKINLTAQCDQLKGSYHRLWLLLSCYGAKTTKTSFGEEVILLKILYVTYLLQDPSEFIFNTSAEYIMDVETTGVAANASEWFEWILSWVSQSYFSIITPLFFPLLLHIPLKLHWHDIVITRNYNRKG